MESLGVMKKVIITGASGFIGFALTKRFVEEDFYVYAIVREDSLNANKLEKLANVHVISCNLSEVENLVHFIPECEVEMFYHLAWQGVADKEAWDYSIQMKNVEYACKAVKVASKLKVKKFIFASSIMEYEVMKLMETEILADMRSVYRTAKLTAHYMTRILANDEKMDYNSANISNVYGEGEVSARFINTTIREMLQGKRVKFTEAKQMYDFVYIDDAVEMLRLIGIKGVPNKNYYVGSMQPRVLREYIYELRDCINEGLKLGIGENKNFVGVSLNYDEFDINACKDDFQFMPQYTFKEGIQKTIEWIKMEKQNENSECGDSNLQ